ncbi:MAG: hypothetical protein M0R80_13325 [Proteobacteria bacterium]|jgi:hypothetical protein|nr:hypothetical protein [Pseudomonadota bacterium]
MTKHQAIKNACRLINLAWMGIDPMANNPCDCFCGKNVEGFQADIETFNWVRDAIVEKQEREGKIVNKNHEAFRLGA